MLKFEQNGFSKGAVSSFNRQTDFNDLPIMFVEKKPILLGKLTAHFEAGLGRVY